MKCPCGHTAALLFGDDRISRFECVDPQCNNQITVIHCRVCGTNIDGDGPGRDVDCPKCGQAYNSAGQMLADRSQWGEETGETASDYDQGFANHERAFDGDY